MVCFLLFLFLAFFVSFFGPVVGIERASRRERGGVERSVRYNHCNERGCGDGFHGSRAIHRRPYWKSEKSGGSSSWGVEASFRETYSERGSRKKISLKRGWVDQYSRVYIVRQQP